MRIKKLFFSMVLFCSGWVQAQTVWPAVQSNMYPYIPNMKLVRHEQTVLLGEGNQQTGIFYSILGDTYSEQVSNELINDALLKSWTLHSLVRLGMPASLTPEVAAVSLQSHGLRANTYQIKQLTDIRSMPCLLQGVDGTWLLLTQLEKQRAKVQSFTDDQATPLFA